MKVLDSGHIYELAQLDRQEVPPINVLTFVKRVGAKYPGNVDAHAGTTIQEVLRACIDRLKYLDNQRPHDLNERVVHHLREAIYNLEWRAAELHGRSRPLEDDCIEYVATCPRCLHIECEGTCHV